MKLDTRFKLFRKDYNSIRDDNKTIDQIWNKNDISLKNKIEICINNNYLDKLKEVSLEETEQLLEEISSYNQEDLVAYYPILSVLYAKKDYSLIPKFNANITQYEDVSIENYKPCLLFAFNYFLYQDQDINLVCGKYLIYSLRDQNQNLFVDAIENDINIRETFFKVIEKDSIINEFVHTIDTTPRLLDFFCKDHPEWFLDRVYNIKNYNKLGTSNMIGRNIAMFFKDDLKPLVAYYTPGPGHKEDISSLLDSLFNLEEEENEYIAHMIIYNSKNDHYIEFLLKNQLQRPGFIKKLVELEKKYLNDKKDNFMAFYYRYANSPLIDELLSFDLDKLSDSEKEELIVKINILAKKPRLKAADNVEILNANKISDLEKKGYEVSAETAMPVFRGNPQSSDRACVFDYQFEVIKIDSNATIYSVHTFSNGNHLKMLQDANKDNPEFIENAGEFEILKRMTHAGYIVILTEGSNCIVTMPEIEKITLEQIQEFKKLISEKGNDKAEYTYGFMLESGAIDEFAGSKNNLLEVLDNISIQKSEQQEPTMK